MGVGYRHSVGSSAAPLITATDLLVHRGSGSLYFQCHNGVAALKTDEVRMYAQNRDAIIVLGSTPGDKGDYDLIRHGRGNMTIAGNAAFGASAVLQVGYMEDQLNDARLLIESGAETLPTFEQNGGESILHNVVTAMRLMAGTCTKDKATATTADIFSGASLIWNHTAGGTINVHAGGFLDCLNNSVKKVFTNVFVHPGGRIRYDSQLHTFAGAATPIFLAAAAA
jgi:hypothetical protein